MAIPDSAVSLGAGPYRAQVFRTILDLNEASVLLRPTWDAAGPLLRVSAPKAAAPVEGAAVAFNLLPEQCLCYWSLHQKQHKSPQASRTCGLYFHIWQRLYAAAPFRAIFGLIFLR